jgi:hypothetical protein
VTSGAGVHVFMTIADSHPPNAGSPESRSVETHVKQENAAANMAPRFVAILICPRLHGEVKNDRFAVSFRFVRRSCPLGLKNMINERLFRIRHFSRVLLIALWITTVAAFVAGGILDVDVIAWLDSVIRPLNWMCWAALFVYMTAGGTLVFRRIAFDRRCV